MNEILISHEMALMDVHLQLAKRRGDDMGTMLAAIRQCSAAQEQSRIEGGHGAS